MEAIMVRRRELAMLSTKLIVAALMVPALVLLAAGAAVAAIAYALT
jgi:hypothetical protein